MLEECSWISITSTVHKLLAHTWELILENEKQGLGSLDESGNPATRYFGDFEQRYHVKDCRLITLLTY